MRKILRTVAVLLLLTAEAVVAQGTKAALQPAEQRKAAPELGLNDTDKKQVNLRNYRGQVVILDFWATWCHGCKEEMPWFAEIQRKYGDEGLNVIGISMDDGGWNVVEPFIEKTLVPYPIGLGNDSTSKAYEIGNMPDAFLIDREGRIAATYVGVVDRTDLEKNIQTLLVQK